MKVYLILLIPIILLNCNDSKKKTDTPIEKKVSDTNTLTEISATEQDTLKSNPNDIHTTNKIQSGYPNWLNNKNGEINEELSEYGNSKINKYMKLNDSISFAIFEFNDGVCTKFSLDTFLNEKEIDALEISVSCDHDLSIPEYEWKEYQLIEPKTIKLKEYREYVHDSLIDSNGHMKDEYDFSEAETKIDTVISFFQIQANGEVYKLDKNLR